MSAASRQRQEARDVAVRRVGKYYAHPLRPQPHEPSSLVMVGPAPTSHALLAASSVAASNRDIVVSHPPTPPPDEDVAKTIARRRPLHAAMMMAALASMGDSGRRPQ